MLRKLQLILFLAAMLLQNSRLLSQDPKQVNLVSTAVPFLRIPPDARASGMGNTGIATTPDVNAVFWNPGKIPFSESPGGFVANYSPWLREWASDMYFLSAGGYYKLDNMQSIQFAMRYFNPGALQFTDNNGNQLQSFRPNEFGIEAGYSRKLSDKTGLGMGMKYIRSNLASDGDGTGDYKAGNAVAFDLGLYYDKSVDGNGWAFGLALSNLGSKISYTQNANEKSFLPANLGLGTSYNRNFDQHKLSIAFDLNKLLVPTPPAEGNTAGLAEYRNKSVVGSWFSSFSDASGGFSEELKEFQVSLGVEYWYKEQFALRTGYFYEDRSKGNRKFFTLGAGISYNIATLNFSYLVPTGNGTNVNPLVNTLQFGLIFRFENLQEK